MRKQGPCDHCGVAESPLWRNGPTEKPVLCNACGSRWRLRRSLRNYVPNHSYVLRKRKLRKTDTDFCYYGNVVKIEEDDSLCSDGIQPFDELIACPSLKSSSESTISDQPTVKIEPVGEDENPEGAGIDQPCIAEVPSENWHFSHIEDLHRNLWELYANRRFASSYEPKEATLIYHDTLLAPSVGKESSLGVVLLEPPKIPKNEVSKALPLLLGADISIVEAPKRRKTPSKITSALFAIVVDSILVLTSSISVIFARTKLPYCGLRNSIPLLRDQMLEAEEWRGPAGNDTFFSPTIFQPFRLLALSSFLGLVFGLVTMVESMICVIGQLSLA